MPSCVVEKLDLVTRDTQGLTFTPGNVTVFLGPNSAGKSQLLNDIFGAFGHADASIAARGIQLRTVERAWLTLTW